MKQGSVSVNDLIAKTDSSPATIRRDLKVLEENKLIIRSHGYAHSVNSLEPVLPLNKRSTIASEEKLSIAKMASGFIQDGMTLILDSGTTCQEIARQIVNKNVTVVTNSIEICRIFMNSEVKVIVCGGMLEKQQMCLLGPDALSFLRKIEVDIAFIGATGIRQTQGLTTSSPLQLDFKQEVIKVSKRSYAVFDLSKFNSANIYLFAQFQELDGVFTNTPAPGSKEEKILTEIQKNGIEVFLTN